ncbi:MAG: VOC family protein [Magnetococcales bacterium]|nr:VOC family protein [Magnetococcales bacterium]
MRIQFHHVAYQCTDFEAGLHFFRDLLGFTVIQSPRRYKERMLCYLQQGSLIIELYNGKPSKGPLEPYHPIRGGLDHLSFIVEDVQETVKALSHQGVTVLKEPFQPPTGVPDQPWVAFIAGPDGQEIELRSGP